MSPLHPAVTPSGAIHDPSSFASIRGSASFFKAAALHRNAESGKLQKFLFFNVCVIFSLARRGDVDYPCCVARQGGPTEMPFRLLGFSCWDDRSGRFFFTGSACDRLIESTASDGDIPAKWALGVAANLLESCHETDPIW